MEILNSDGRGIVLGVTGASYASGEVNSAVIAPTGGLTSISLGAARGNPKFTVLSTTGYVGIGTTNPSSKFEVHNDVTGNDSAFVITNEGTIAIGANSVSNGVALEINSTDKGLRLPRLDTANVLTPQTGLVVYQSTDNTLYYYNGSNWVSTSSDETIASSESPTPLIFGGNGIEVDIVDVTKVWGGSGITTGATSSTDGAANTAAIVAALGAGDYAAYYCDTLTSHGYTDWYLPAKNQLRSLCANSSLLVNFGGNYHSSTEAGPTRHYYVSPSFSGFNGWYETSTAKTTSRPVRCIRQP